MVQRKFDKVNYKSKKKIKLNEEDWIIVENCVDPIISKDDFEKIQKMKKNNVARSPKGYNYLLKGLVVCGDCGRVMSVRRRTNKRKLKEDNVETYYCCSNNIRFRHGICSLHYFQEEKLNDIVISYLKDTFHKYVNKNDLKEIGKKKQHNKCETQNLASEILKYNKKIDSLKVAVKNLYIDKINNIISEEEFIEIKQQLEKDKDECVNKVNELNQFVKKLNKNSENTSFIDKKIKEFLDLKKPDKQILMDLIDKIEIMKDKQVRIHVKFNLE